MDTLHTRTHQPDRQADVVVDGVVVIANALRFSAGPGEQAETTAGSLRRNTHSTSGFQYVLDPESGAGVYKLKEPIKDVKVVRLPSTSSSNRARTSTLIPG